MVSIPVRFVPKNKIKKDTTNLWFVLILHKSIVVLSRDNPGLPGGRSTDRYEGLSGGAGSG